MRGFCRSVHYVVFFALLAIGAEARGDVCDGTGRLEEPAVHALALLASRLLPSPPHAWTVSAASAFGQQFLARPRGSERLSAAAVAQYRALFARLSPADVDQLESSLAQLGFYRTVPPPVSQYDYILLNGSTAQGVRQRIHALAEAVASGALQLQSRTQILFLDGERKLFASETAEILSDPRPYDKEPGWVAPKTLPRDERAMDEMLWQQMRLPTELRSHGILFIHARKQLDAARAETADCVRAWICAHHPTVGRALVVSNNPFVEYQRRVTEVYLASLGAAGMQVDAMGPAAELDDYDAPTRLGVLLDALAGNLLRANQQRELGLFAAQQTSAG